MKRISLEQQAERLLRSCAITFMLKGFYPLRDLIILYYQGKISVKCPRKSSSILAPIYGKNHRSAMHRALLHSWRRPECRLVEFMGCGPLETPPSIEDFALALCRQMETPT